MARILSQPHAHVTLTPPSHHPHTTLSCLPTLPHLGQVLDGVDVVVRRRGDETHPGGRHTVLSDILRHLLGSDRGWADRCVGRCE